MADRQHNTPESDNEKTVRSPEIQKALDHLLTHAPDDGQPLLPAEDRTALP